ncbi:hypothetical protein DEU40_12272 [Chryseobacterium sp. AG844]|nr:hypothetical protein DEU40_12272 [Chryseobacterium sp. AG844]
MTYTYVKGAFILQHEIPYLNLNIETADRIIKKSEEKIFSGFFTF